MKKILAVLLSLLMLMMSMAVYATEAEHVHDGCCGEIELAAVVPETPIEPMVEYCSNCGTGTIKYFDYTKKVYEYRPCSHIGGNPEINDQYYVTYRYYGYACSNCVKDSDLAKKIVAETLIKCFGT